MKRVSGPARASSPALSVRSAAARSVSGALFNRPLTRFRVPVQLEPADHARGRVMDVLPENVRRQPPGHVRRRGGGAPVLPAGPEFWNRTASGCCSSNTFSTMPQPIWF
ncbi:ubiquinol-cytochrome c reductase complex assembly factor 6 isoform X2 [Sagmatias obliquidens]|uniref:ubiquinol-cytochrome c reductase complex assembly factor 6 isoform X2 n=1 Tax=Sagmatias obliquidens TaxID=3371155 RepID=UPI000F43E68E|nr:uncharacterized protein C12orf73 homolog isoform X2 [Lagenorhynchus obliquidens]